MDFGKRVRSLRRQKGLTKEEFCDDELELSVRQLTRIENGQSTPTLAKIEYIARRLGLSIAALTNDGQFDLPQRYRELKHRLLRLQTYADPQRLAKRDAFFAEIAQQFYDKLPEEERLVIDCLKTKSDINLTKTVDFNEGLLKDYFRQVTVKSQYSINDLVFISLYFMCILVSGYDSNCYDDRLYAALKQTLLQQVTVAPLDHLFLVHSLILDTVEISFGQGETADLEEIFKTCYDLMTTTQDFQKMPITCLLEWKYSLLFLEDKERALKCYNKAVLFAQMTGDTYLEGKLKDEWQKDAVDKISDP